MTICLQDPMENQTKPNHKPAFCISGHFDPDSRGAKWPFHTTHLAISAISSANRRIHINHVIFLFMVFRFGIRLDIGHWVTIPKGRLVVLLYSKRIFGHQNLDVWQTVLYNLLVFDIKPTQASVTFLLCSWN